MAVANFAIVIYGAKDANNYRCYFATANTFE